MKELKSSIKSLKDNGYKPREAFGFKPTEPFVTPQGNYAHAKIHFNDLDGNSLEFICKISNPKHLTDHMYLSEWEKLND